MHLICMLLTLHFYHHRHHHYRVRSGLCVSHRLLLEVVGLVLGPRTTVRGAVDHGHACGFHWVQRLFWWGCYIRNLLSLGLPDYRYLVPYGGSLRLPPHPQVALGGVPVQVL